MDEIEALRGAFARVDRFDEFDPEDRLWWIELRNTAAAVLQRHEVQPATANSDELAALRTCFDRLKSSPERDPEEPILWPALRIAVEVFLERCNDLTPRSPS
ncbi:MAG: hypothetical protein AAF494_01640 [Pseudomonadota bacterium]